MNLKKIFSIGLSTYFRIRARPVSEMRRNSSFGPNSRPLGKASLSMTTMVLLDLSLYASSLKWQVN